jgi:DEAD/DEAH box helicase domain-containing protein
MIPSIVADELRETLLDYLDTTFSFQDIEVGRALQDFLSGPEKGIFKGPYVQLRLPFRRGDDREMAQLLDIHPSFTPYVHQILSFERLTSKDGHQPQPTLVTTGTGSGKTECFLYPLLDHCFHQIGQPGIKAIILYPMNALAADQARRLAKEIWEDPRLKGKVTAGMYVGGKGNEKIMGEEHVITDRDVLRDHPPDILLTNYKMLDFLLLRPEDQKIWQQTGPESVRYLVLDELHTYDGAQGSDVACLIRRLKAKLEVKSGSLCCVGTSATLAGDEATATAELIDFAGRLFGEVFPRGSVITEDRLDRSEYLKDEEDYSTLPAYSEEMWPGAGDDSEQYVTRQAQLWFGQGDVDPLGIGQALSRHGFLRTVLMALDGRIAEWHELEEGIGYLDPDFEDLPTEQRRAMLQSFLALVSAARRLVGERTEPFLQCQAQLWVREMSRLVRQVDISPKFFWRDDVPVGNGPRGLPAVYCRECGHAGWLGFMRKQDRRVTEDPAVIYGAYFDRSNSVRYFFPGLVEGDLFQTYLCPSCLAVGTETKCVSCDVEGVPVRVHLELSQTKVPRDMQRCPSCETDFGLSLVGSQASSLSSVAISHLYLSPFNTEKKLLAFTDSVQDASHRSGFFGARTYRFNLRTAIQTIVEQGPGDEVPLDEFVDRFIEYWSTTLSAQELAATFMPPDLQYLPEYRSFMEGGKTQLTPKVRSALRRRLSWEIVMEYGFNARVGRTLDKVRCSTTSFDENLLGPALDKLQEVLVNQIGGLQGLTADELCHFVVGLLTRTKVRGGVSHEMLRQYAEKNGNGYFLSKDRNPYMSPFGRQSRLPRLLSLQPNEKVFDSAMATGNSRTWYLDWARRSLNRALSNILANDIYRLTLPVLEEFGLLERLGKNNQFAYSIPQKALIVNGRTAQARSADGHYLTVPEEQLAQWIGMPSLSYLGKGEYAEDPTDNQSFYRNVYRSGRIKRIFTHEHSGLLDRETREGVEEDFKEAKRADAPNLLTCTPTLEMGIDIGDLSSTMVCSIPPTPTNYLQRIGRAGRATGNALVLALANVRPHDLYFFEDPFEMISGTVTPPGCYLDAPEMLKRQFLAFCMDSWCSDDPAATSGGLPNRVMNLLAQNRRGGFPQNFLQYFRGRQDTLPEQFVGLFQQVLGDDSVERLRRYGFSEELPESIDECLLKTERRVERLRNQRQLIRDRRDRVKKEPEKFDNAEQLLEEYQQEMQLLSRLIRQIQEQYPLNLFTDEGLLPNYAFPESGVRLKSLIYGIEEENEQGQITKSTDAHEYMRGASVAIRELAPFNTFYAEARKVVIDQVDTGGRRHSQIEEWRFCDVCSHTEPALLKPQQKTCPHCGSAGWEDVGQRRNLLKLAEVSSRDHHFRSQSGDETDEREQESYLLKDFIDVLPENWGGGYAVEEGLFGFEYLHQATLRQVNFGRQTNFGQTFMAAGQEVPEEGFLLCPDCGVAKRSHNEDDEQIEHRYWCYFNQGDRQPEWGNVFLYRQVQSEAIRILLPVSTFQAQEKLSTFKACLELGLRKKFKGNPGHLVLREQEDPGIGGDGAPRRFLILYDDVPGGTGYLKEFARHPEALRQVLEAAFRTLKSCRCRRRPGADGCYRCVYAYQRQRELEFVSRELGIELLGEILGKWDRLEEVQTLSQIDVPDSMVESELEGRFIHALGCYIAKKNKPWSKVLRAGKSCYEFELQNHKWVLEPQVLLGHSQGIPKPSKPDFVLWPSGKQNKALPVAVFMDGFAYHVCPDEPKGRIGDDIEKRMSLIKSGHFQVWSLTWDDVNDFEDDPEQAAFSLLLDTGMSPKQLTGLLKKANSPFAADFLAWGSFFSLIHYLEKPDLDIWRLSVGTAALVAMMPVPPFRDIEEVEAQLDALRHSNELEKLELTAVDGGQHLGRLYQQQYLTLLLHSSKDAANDLATDIFSVFLRLEDTQVERQAKGYKMAWRRCLHAANFLQFLPGFDWVSTELIAEEPPWDGGEGDAEEEPSPIEKELREVLEFSDESCHAFLQEWSRAGGALPEVGFELIDGSGCVCADAELAWPARKVAVLMEDQEEFKGMFEDQQWLVFHAPQLQTESDKIEAILNGADA